MILCLFILAIFFPVYSQPHGARRTVCMSNIKQITLAFIMYANDYDNRLPEAGRWMDRLGPYARHEDMFHDSVANILPPDCGYAFRRSASRLSLDTLTSPAKFALDFDSDLLGRNASSDLSTLPHPGRHERLDVIGYADGHAKSVRIARARTVTTAGK